MKIKEETLQSYNELKERGDITKLAKIINRSRITVYSILKNGVCEPVVAVKLKKFFKDRKREVQLAQDQD